MKVNVVSLPISEIFSLTHKHTQQNTHTHTPLCFIFIYKYYILTLLLSCLIMSKSIIAIKIDNFDHFMYQVF